MMAITPGFCMTLRGWPCVWNCVMPIGRQFASGLSLSFTAIRCFFSSVAHGVRGKPLGTFAPSSQKAAIGGELGSALGAGV